MKEGPQSFKVRAIDLKPGMFVIVSEWLDESLQDEPGVESWMRGDRRRKPVGDPLKVLAVALPFVTIDFLPQSQRGVLDTRQCVFIKVDANYVRSLVPNYFKKTKKLTDKQKREAEQTRRDIFVASKGVWETIVEKKK